MESAPPALAHAETALRDNAGCRGTPSTANALTGNDCRVLAEELDRLRDELTEYKASAERWQLKWAESCADYHEADNRANDLRAELDAAKAELAAIWSMAMLASINAGKGTMGNSALETVERVLAEHARNGACRICLKILESEPEALTAFLCAPCDAKIAANAQAARELARVRELFEDDDGALYALVELDLTDAERGELRRLLGIG